MSKPKYVVGDQVQFQNNGKIITGTIYSVNFKKTYLCPDGYSYKVLSDYMLYKNVNENRLVSG